MPYAIARLRITISDQCFLFKIKNGQTNCFNEVPCSVSDLIGSVCSTNSLGVKHLAKNALMLHNIFANVQLRSEYAYTISS